MTLRQLLNTTQLGDVLTERQHVVALDHDQTVGQVLETLSKHHILSAPLVVRPDGSTQSLDTERLLVKALVGFVSVEDFLTAFLAGNIHEPLLTVIRRGFLQSVEPLPSPTATHSSMGAAPSKVVHRLAVFDSCQEPPQAFPHLLGIFSQMDAIRFLAKQMGALGPLGRQSLGALGLVPLSSTGLLSPRSVAGAGHGAPHFGKHHLVTVPQEMGTIQALQVLHELGASGAAVVDSRGSLAGNLSVSDLRCLAPGLFAALLLPVKDFLTNRPLLMEVQLETSSEMMDVDSDGSLINQADQPPAGLPAGRLPVMPPGVVTCQATSTFAEALALVARHSVHRVWVVDPDSRPLAAVTLTDMLRVVCRDCEPPAPTP